MSEGSPKKLPEEREGRETVPLPEYRIIKREVMGAHGDGSKTERIIECNGYIHRFHVDKIFYDEKGEVTFAEEKSKGRLKPCDKKHS